MPGAHLPSLPRLGSLVSVSDHKVRLHTRIVVLGAARVGKTAIVQQFLYGNFPVIHLATVDEVHRSEYEVKGIGKLTLDILDTSGSYEFPAMKRLAIGSADAIVLVYALNDAESFEEMRRLRDEVIQQKSACGTIPEVESSKAGTSSSSGCSSRSNSPNVPVTAPSIPIVVVGNKSDLEDRRVISKELAETIITIDWENGYVECSAKDDENIVQVFQEVMVQSKVPYDIGPAVKRRKPRRRSLPAYPTSPTIKDKIMPKRNSCAVS